MSSKSSSLSLNAQVVSLPISHMSKSVRLDFPRFKGDDPASWVFKSSQYFSFYQTPFDERLLMASFHMDGDALVWFQDSDENGVFATWEGFVDALLTRFGSTAYEDPMESLTKLRQTSNVVIYKGQFEALSNRIKGLSESHKLSCFLNGLKDEVRLPVKMLQPKNLNEAFGLAKIQEEYLNSSRRGQRFSFDSAKPSILGPRPEGKVESRLKLPL